MKTLTRMFLATAITVAAMGVGLTHTDDMKKDDSMKHGDMKKDGMMKDDHMEKDGMKEDTMMKDDMDKS